MQRHALRPNSKFKYVLKQGGATSAFFALPKVQESLRQAVATTSFPSTFGQERELLVDLKYTPLSILSIACVLLNECRIVLTEIKNRDVTKMLGSSAALQAVDGDSFFRNASHYLDGKRGLRLPIPKSEHSHEPSKLEELGRGSWMVRLLQHMFKLKSKGNLELKPAGNVAYYQECTGQDRSKKGNAGKAIIFYEAVEVKDGQACPAYIINENER
jgi:hypothetical protein